jgi:integral membrane protein
VPSALTRYRVMAYVTGVLLLVLVFVAMPLKYFGDNDTPVAIVGVAHGWLYMVYLVTAFWLAYQRRWSATKTILVLLAGTVPFMSFVAERRVTRDERRASVSREANAAVT